VARDGRIYSAGAGTGGGLVELKAGGGGVQPDPGLFLAQTADGHRRGGVGREHLFGTGGQGMVCAEFATGTLKWEERALGAASLCLADRRLYLHARMVKWA